MRNIISAFIVIVSFIAAPLRADESPKTLDSHFEPLRSLLGKTFKGQFANAKPDQPLVDVARWERALNGRAVRVLHSINDGMYGGEIVMVWNDEKQEIAYHYFTTAGFTSTGTVKCEANQIITREYVAGSKEGITEVKGITTLRPDGSYHVKSEYLKEGKWVPGHEATYSSDPSAEVKFH